MEEINLKELFEYFVSKLPIIVIAALLTTLVGIAYGLWIQKPMYNSYTTIVLTRTDNDSTTTDGTGITQSDILLNQNLVSTYREIIKSKRILNQVINNLDLNISTDELEKNISVTSEKDTEVIKISVNSSNPTDAKDIANEIERVFSNEIISIYNIKNITIIDYAEEDTTPYNINVPKQIILAFLIGFILACAVIFVTFYFDTTIKSSEEIENKLGLPVLGVVPIKSISKNKRRRS